MAISTISTMTDRSRALVRLLTWLSPAFPTGGYAYSHGLEWAVEAGDVTDETTLRDWLEDVLLYGSGRNDAIALRHAHRAAHDPRALAEVAEVAIASAASHERRAEALDQGAAFLRAAAVWCAPELPARIPYAVAAGAISGAQGIPEEDVAVAFLQAFTGNLISAAVRLVPLGQTTGLRVLAELEPIILDVAERTRAAQLDEMGGCTFRSDIAAIRHETQYSRLFRT